MQYSLLNIKGEKHKQIASKEYIQYHEEVQWELLNNQEITNKQLVVM